MTIQFKQLDKQVSIKTEYNTRHIYLRDAGTTFMGQPDLVIDVWPSVVALLKYRLYQKTAGLREFQESWKVRTQRLREALRPAVIAWNVKTWAKYRLNRLVAPLRHYVGLTRAIKRYKVV